MSDQHAGDPQPHDRGACPACAAEIRRDGWLKHWEKQHPADQPPPFPDQPYVVLSRLCARHEHDLIVRRLKLGEHGPWLLALVTAQIMLFTWVSGDPRFVARTEGEVENFSLVLAEMGCLACWDRDAYVRMIRVQRKGLGHAARVAQGNAIDPDWPIAGRAAAMPRPGASSEQADGAGA